MVKYKRISRKLIKELRLPSRLWTRVFSVDTSYLRKGNIMKNRNLIIGLAFAGLSAQLFTFICTGALKQGYIDGFNFASMITLFSAFILSLWSQPCPKDRDREREDIYRDIDAVYRHIDDTARDLREDIRDCSRNCESKACKMPCGKK